MSILEIQPAACRARQERLLEVMAKRGVDLTVVTQIEHVQYLAGPRFGPVFQPAAALTADGKLYLVSPNEPPVVSAADDIGVYEAQWKCTLRNDQREASAAALGKLLAGKVKAKRVGVEGSSFGPHMAEAIAKSTGGEIVDIEPEIFQLRRKKDPDELARLEVAIAATGKMYAAAREMIKPGVLEIDVFNRLQSVAVAHFGEMLTGTGNDYACGVRGGPPRNGRAAQAGELYLLDLGPAFRGYFADNCRAVAVTEPTEAQLKACKHISGVFDLVKSQIKPGVSAKKFFGEIHKYLNDSGLGVFDHHLGHGIGLFPHEAPHLNDSWDDTFQVGEVFACEPALYAPELNAGIRLENDFLVTESGVKLLSDFPLELRI